MTTTTSNNCANCFKSLSSIQRGEHQIWVNLDNSNGKDGKWVKVSTILSTIFKLHYFDNNLLQPTPSPHHQVEEGEDDSTKQGYLSSSTTTTTTHNNSHHEVPVRGDRENVDLLVCGDCAINLSNLYKFYYAFIQKSHDDSFLTKKTHQIDTILDQFQATWKEMQDCNNTQNPNDNDEIEIDGGDTSIINRHNNSTTTNNNNNFNDENTISNNNHTHNLMASNLTTRGPPWVLLRRLTAEEISAATSPKDYHYDNVANNDSKKADRRPLKSQRCPLCSNKYFNTPRLLKLHMFKIHIPTSSTTCPICGQTFGGPCGRRDFRSHFMDHTVTPETCEKWVLATLLLRKVRQMQLEINNEHVSNKTPATEIAAAAVDTSVHGPCSSNNKTTTITIPGSTSDHDDPIVTTTITTTQSNVVMYPKNPAAAATATAAVNFIKKEEDIVVKVEPDLIMAGQEQVDEENDVKFSTADANNPLDDSKDMIDCVEKFDGVPWTYPCEYCKFQSLTKFGLECHSSVIHGQSTFCCLLLDCFNSFGCHKKLSEHMKEHRILFYCVICQQKVSSAWSLEMHKRMAHHS